MTTGHPTRSTPAEDAASRPIVVSVVIPVWNVEPYLAQCLDSVLGQTIGLDRLEIIAVDDGSTDASGSILDGYAAQHPQVIAIHQPNSGGPGQPRNVGLEHATGRYVFFLDADDYLGPEALERMVAMAEEHGTDIVLGRMAGVDGRPVPSRVFRRTVGRARVEDVFSTLSVLKLFRRSMLERSGLRFPEGIARGEDGAFTARAYFDADGISIVGDYDCYYCRDRPGSQTRSVRTYDFPGHIARIEERLDRVARSSRPGSGRDRMTARLLKDTARVFGPRWLELDPVARRDAFDRAASLVRRWGSPWSLRRLQPWHALRAYCLARGLFTELEAVAAVPTEVAFGEALVEGRRVFARYPHFRDGSGIPDRCFDITASVELQQSEVRAEIVAGTLRVSGIGYLALLGGSTALVLRRWPRGPELVFPAAAVATPRLRDSVYVARRHPNAGFEAAVELATAAAGMPLGRGTWGLWLRTGTSRLQLTRPLLAGHGARITRRDGLYVARSGRVRLRRGRPGPALRLLEQLEAAWLPVPRALRRLRGGLARRL